MILRLFFLQSHSIYLQVYVERESKRDLEKEREYNPYTGAISGNKNLSQWPVEERETKQEVEEREKEKGKEVKDDDAAECRKRNKDEERTKRANGRLKGKKDHEKKRKKNEEKKEKNKLSIHIDE